MRVKDTPTPTVTQCAVCEAPATSGHLRTKVHTCDRCRREISELRMNSIEPTPRGVNLLASALGCDPGPLFDSLRDTAHTARAKLAALEAAAVDNGYPGLGVEW